MPHETPSLQFGTVAMQLGLVAFLVLLNGFFVAAEFALVSVRKTRIDQLAAEGNQLAGAVQRALHDLDRQIGAAQVGITIVSLILGSTGEKIFEPLFAHMFSTMGMPAALLGVTRVGIALVLAYLVMTTLHVVIGEQLPKMFAIQRAEISALWIVRPMMWFTWMCSPLVWFLTGSVNFFLRRLGLSAGEGHAQVHSPQELDLLFTQSHEGGQLSQTEREILHRVVKFSDLSAREVMVPRMEMKTIPVEMSAQAFVEWLHSRPNSRTPVFRDSPDEIVGVAHLKDLVPFEAGLRGEGSTLFGEAQAENLQSINLMPALREALRVPETITIDKLLVEFQKSRQQMAIVIDEYGGTSGLITMGDLLEQVVGDVHDEFDQPEPEIVEKSERVMEVSGRLLIDEFNERFAVGFRSDDADTMAGLVLNALGRPAEIGDEIVVHHVLLRVVELDRLRIAKLLVTLPPDTEK